MLYNILSRLANLMLRIYFDEVNVTGIENIPKDKPLVLAANHQSAFLEPVLLGALMPFPTHFITRGDVFVKRYMWFFKATNQIPIFRFQDGFKQMKKNMDSFQRVYDALGDGARVIIFCEGKMQWKKVLQPLQKGAARMAIGGYKQNPELDIYVVPIGINYQNHILFRRKVDISCATPIRLNDFNENIEENERKILNTVTTEIGNRLQPEVIHIGSETNYETADRVMDMHLNQKPRQFTIGIHHDKSWHDYLVNQAKKTAALDTDSDLLSNTQNYIKSLPGSFLHSDYVIAHEEKFKGNNKLSYYLFHLPLGVLGVILHGIPAYLNQYITNKRTEQPEFHASVKSILSIAFFVVHFLLCLIFLAFFKWQIMLLGILAYFFFATRATYYWDRKDFWKSSKQLNALPQSTVQELKNQRAQIMHSFE